MTLSILVSIFAFSTAPGVALCSVYYPFSLCYCTSSKPPPIGAQTSPLDLRAAIASGSYVLKRQSPSPRLPPGGGTGPRNCTSRSASASTRRRRITMGRKKRNRAQLKPFCFYCDREFDDEKVLIQHQKAKHFKCSECNRKLDTATGLVVHMLQVHKETVTRVPNALNGRDNPELIIHGMDGVPIELLNEKQSILDQERGAAKHSKSAHTTFGMSVMSGFMNQIGGPGDQLFNSMGMPGFPMPQAPLENPFAFNQFMAHMQHGPQAAFQAMFGLPAPQLDPNVTAYPGPSVIPPRALAAGGDGTAEALGAAGSPQQTKGGLLSAFGSLNLQPPQFQQPQQQPAAEARLPNALTSALAAKAGRLMLETEDDTISPEETRARWQRYAAFVPTCS